MFKAYQEYKDSGVEWLGNVPSYWNITKFSSIFYENKIKNKGMIEKNLLSLSYGRIIEKDIDEKKGLKPESFETYQLVSKNDIIFRFTDLQNDKKSLRSAISKFNGIITSAYIGVKCKTSDNPDYLNYLFRSYDLKKVFYSMGDGMRQSLKMEELNRLPITIPPQQEQTQIATFLDQETQKIDHLISKQEKLIELLEEQRKSIISYAVTKGINPNAEMKDSGVEWLGEVPKDWEISRFSSIFQENKRKNKGMIENNLLSLSYGSIIEKDINNAKGLMPENFESYQIIYPKDIIFRFTDLQNDKKSLRSAYSTFKGIITSAYISVSSRKEIDVKFYHYLFRTYDLMKVFYSMGDGMRQSLKMSELNKMLILFPTLKEQQKIVNYIEQENTKINNLIQKQTALIEKLKEYRSSIISHAVTGKIDVRDGIK